MAESMKYQVLKILKSKECFGKSKHKDLEEKKQQMKEKKYNELIKQGKEADISEIRISKNEVFLAGIYSFKSFETYMQKGMQFTKWLEINHPEVKMIKDSVCYASEYFQYLEKERKLSATSLRGHGSALAKLFGRPASTLGYKFPSKDKTKISKGRKKQDWDDSIRENYGPELRVLSVTGLRRREATGVKIEQISDDYSTIHNVKGKNGKIRDVKVLEPKVLKAYVEKHRQGEEKLFPKLPQRMNIQRERRHYVEKFYEIEFFKIFSGEETLDYKEKDKKGKLIWYITRGEEMNRHYYKPILIMISKNLGHNRLSVVVSNYLQ
jgi:integrase